MRITNLSAECVPFAKTGGLGDVAAALPKALHSRGHDVDVFMPFHLDCASWYRRRNSWPEAATEPFRVGVLGQDYEVGLLRGAVPGSDVPVYFVAHDPVFHRRGIYSGNERGEDDNIWRFSLFVRAAVEGMKRLGRKPEVLQTHDWHPALAPMLGAWSSWRDPWWDDVASVLTIHNIGYQGIYEPGAFKILGLPEDVWTGGLLGWKGALNLMKGAVMAADQINAVSPTYAREIQTKDGGHGLDAVLRSRSERLSGILNGVDTEEWNPSKDKNLPAHYSAADLAGKLECRAELCHLADFEPGDPSMILVAIGRLTSQKGFDLLLEAAPELVRRGIRIAMLGSGDTAIEGSMRVLESHAHGRFKAFVGYDEVLAHKLEAGADAFVMPSRFEPCGLSQMYSLAYGTPPIVRRTGGLADSVVGFDGRNLEHANGFFFDGANAHELAAAVLFAQRVFFQRDLWRRIQANGMAVDNSWNHSAQAYEEVYRRARAVRGLSW